MLVAGGMAGWRGWDVWRWIGVEGLVLVLVGDSPRLHHGSAVGFRR